MDFALSQSETALRERILRLARTDLGLGAADRDRAQSWDSSLWEKCAAAGLLGLPVPQEYGGSSLDPLSTIVALEALGCGCPDGGLAFAVGAHLLSCVVPILKHGTEEQKRKYLPPLCNGSLVAAHAMTEPECGSDAFAMRMSAERQAGGYGLSGLKTMCSNGPVAGLALTYAVTDPAAPPWARLTAFLVDRGPSSFRTGRSLEKMGLRSCSMSELVFEDVRVGDEAVLGDPGSGASIFMQAMDWERVGLAAVHVGTMERLLGRAIERARTRSASGQPIGKFQAVSHRIADMKVRLEAARLLTFRAASRLDQPGAGLDASLTKLFVSESLVETALDTVRVLGGYGFLTEHEAERALRDAVGSTLYSGTSDVQRNIIARWLGL